MSGASGGFPMRLAALSGCMENHPLQTCRNGHERGTPIRNISQGTIVHYTCLRFARQWSLTHFLLNWFCLYCYRPCLSTYALGYAAGYAL
jgi:hypothetical protein